MKYIIAADIHGSAYYCERLLQVLKEEKADKLILLGDLLYHGPRNPLPKDYEPKKVAELLNDHKEEILAVRGNCDSEVDQMVLEFPMLAEYAFLELEGQTFLATHGHVYNEENLPPMAPKTVLLNGHFHVPVFREVGAYVYVNPGSASLPKEDSVPSCLIYEGGNFKRINLDDLKVEAAYSLSS